MTSKAEAIETEAMRIARGLVKAELKRANIKVSGVETSEITKAARRLLEVNPGIYLEAAKELKRTVRIRVKL